MNVTKKEFIFSEPRPTLSCHASTIVALDNGDAVPPADMRHG